MTGREKKDSPRRKWRKGGGASNEKSKREGGEEEKGRGRHFACRGKKRDANINEKEAVPMTERANERERKLYLSHIQTSLP